MPGEKDGVPEMDLDQVMNEGMEKFDGELQEAAAKGPSAPADKADETASQAKPKEEKKETSAKPEETKPEPKDEAKPPEKKEGDEKPPEKKRLFKDQDEAEERYKELQRTLSKTGEEKQELVSKLREKEESDALHQKIATADKDYRGFLRKRMKETTEAIDQLDADATDYDDKVADLRANEQADIDGYKREHPEVFGEAVVRPSRSTPPKQEPKATDGNPAMTRVSKIIEESKVDWGTDDPVFMSYASQAEKTDAQGNIIPFDQQVKTAIERTNAHYEKIVVKRTGGRQKTAEEEALKAQETDLPLGRGATGGKGGPTEKGSDLSQIVSIEAALENVNRERTL